MSATFLQKGFARPTVKADANTDIRVSALVGRDRLWHKLCQNCWASKVGPVSNIATRAFPIGIADASFENLSRIFAW